MFENKNRRFRDSKSLGDLELEDLIDYGNIVTIDPGKNDLFNSMKESPNSNKHIYFRYTQKQRNHETKHDKYNGIREELSNIKINGKTIKEIEKKLLQYNSKTANFDKFKIYIANKVEINRLLFKHYEKCTYRKLRWNTFINTCRSEDNMMNRFAAKMESPKKTLLVIGDWSKGGIKGSQPTITKKLRKIFIKRGYDCCLIWEHNTSKICSHCHGYANPIENPQKADGSKIWKLIKCETCRSIHNRDHNATKNMMYIFTKMIKGRKRPKKFCPKKKT